MATHWTRTHGNPLSTFHYTLYRYINVENNARKSTLFKRLQVINSRNAIREDKRTPLEAILDATQQTGIRFDLDIIGTNKSANKKQMKATDKTCVENRSPKLVSHTSGHPGGCRNLRKRMRRQEGRKGGGMAGSKKSSANQRKCKALQDRFDAKQKQEYRKIAASRRGLPKES